jgi:hypothetical protein
MNYRPLVLLFALGCAPGIDLMAEIEVAAAAQPAPPAQAEQARLTPAQLDELLSPIALYPDPLIALILPASTFPADVVMAARYLKAGGDPQAVETQPWDDSVKALARYPEVVKWMDENLAWTRQLGEVFAFQPAEVLTSTQRLRAAARAAGNLANTPEQTVVVEREVIRIVPAQPEVIYVPVYDPVYVYRPRVVHYYHTGPLVRFSSPYRAGFWLSYHCDWNYQTVLVIARPHRHEVWRTQPRWVCPSPALVHQHHVWQPSRPVGHTVYRQQAAPARQQLAQPASNALASRPRPGALVSPGSGAQHQPPHVSTPAVAARPKTKAPPAVSPDRPGQIFPRATHLSESDRIRQTPRPNTPSSGPSLDEDRRRAERRLQTVRTPAPLAAAPASSPATPPAPRTALSPSPARGIQFETTNRARNDESGLGIRSSGRLSSPRISTAPATGQQNASSGLSPASAHRESVAHAAQIAPSPVPRERSAPRSAMTPRPAPTRSSGASASAPSATLAETEPSSPRSRR